MISGNPRLRGRESPQSGWYRHYPGPSERFGRDALESAYLGDGEWVLDPWNGSPTTRAKLTSVGHKTYLSFLCTLVQLFA